MTSNANELSSPDNSVLPTNRLPSTRRPLTLHSFFVGDQGLRAGWSLVIFFVLLAALLFGTNLIAHRLLTPADAPSANSPVSLRFGLISEGLTFLAVLLATWFMSKVDRRPTSVYGFGGARKLPNFFAGLASGLVCLSLLVLALSKAGLLFFDRRLLFGNSILRYGALWLLGFLLVGLLEEYLTRGYLQYTLTRGFAGIYQWLFRTRHSPTLGFWTAALLLSVLFGLSHKSNPGESPIGLLSAGLGGMVFCFSLWRTGSLWWAIGFHTSWDWSQSFLYGVADSGLMTQQHLFATHPSGRPILSGGTTGPEGSIFILAMLLLILLVVLATYRRSADGQPFGVR